MTAHRTVVICPGRGSYQRAQLGTLQGRSKAVQEFLDRVDAFRSQRGLPTIRELDGAKRYSSAKHVAGQHASLLTFAASVADALELSDKHEIIGYSGNSMGWYTALALSGVLDWEDAFALVQTMADFQTGNTLGGQLLYPQLNPDWTTSSELSEAIERSLANTPMTWWSIRLGSVAVLGADASGIKSLLKSLPPITRGTRTFPLQLPLHSAFHTPLLEHTSQKAVSALKGLRFRQPKAHLFNGHGVHYSPLSADPEQIRAYTLGSQVTEPYNYELATRSALRFLAPSRIVLLGPGNSLGGPTAAILVNEGWSGLKSRADFEQLQTTAPLLFSFGLADQRASLL